MEIDIETQESHKTIIRLLEVIREVSEENGFGEEASVRFCMATSMNLTSFLLSRIIKEEGWDEALRIIKETASEILKTRNDT